MLRTDGTDTSASAYTMVHHVWYTVRLSYLKNGTCELKAWPKGGVEPTVDGTGGVVLTKTTSGAGDAAYVRFRGRGTTRATNIDNLKIADNDF